jgi:TP901 family phage tail tape measure protein
LAKTLGEILYKFTVEQDSKSTTALQRMAKEFFGPTEAALQYGGALSAAAEQGKEFLTIADRITEKLRAMKQQSVMPELKTPTTSPALEANKRSEAALKGWETRRQRQAEKEAADAIRLYRLREDAERRLFKIREDQNRIALQGQSTLARQLQQQMQHYSKFGPFEKWARSFDVFKDKVSGFFAKFTKDSKKMSEDGAHATGKLGIAWYAFSRVIGSVIREIPVLGYGLQAVFQRANMTGHILFGTITGIASSLGTIATKAIQASSEFQLAWAEVTTILEASQGKVDFFRDSVLNMSKDLMESAPSVARGFYQALSSGFTDANEALTLTRVASKAATAGLTDTFTAVDALTTVLNAYGLGAKDATRISDQMFETVLHGKLLFTDLARHIGIGIPFFAQAGIATEEFFAALATLTQGGIRSNIAMTALRGVIAQIIKPTDSALRVAHALGIEFNTEAIATKGLVGWLAELADKTEMNEHLISTLFPDVRGLTAVLALYNKQAKRNAEILHEMNTATGVTDRAYEKMTRTLKGQWDLFKNKVNVEMIKFGDIWRYTVWTNL